MIFKLIILWLIFISLIIIYMKYNYYNNKKEIFSNFKSLDNFNLKDYNIDKLRLQLVVNKFENKTRCCEGYKTPSNDCRFNFDSDINQCCNKY